MPAPKDSWFIAIFDLLLKVIVPLAILLAGWGFTRYQQQSEKEDQLLKTSFDSVSKLASQNQQERLFAVKVLGSYAESNCSVVAEKKSTFHVREMQDSLHRVTDRFDFTFTTPSSKLV